MHDRKNLNRFYIAVILGAALILCIAGVLTTDARGFRRGNQSRSFSDGWTKEDGREVLPDKLRLGNTGADITLSNTLPDNISDNDCLCFETRNLDVTVYLDEEEIYRFRSQENMTGIGYGYTFHIMGLAKEDASHNVTIRCEVVHPDAKGARILGIDLCPSADYLRAQIRNRNGGRMISSLIIYFGLILIIIYLRIKNRKQLPFDAAALGLTAIFIGLWFMLDTNILQLLTGLTFLPRVLSRTIVFLAAYPMIAFFNSLTVTKRPVYLHIAFLLSILTPATLLGMRYFAGVDMITSFNKAVILFIVTVVALIALIFADHSAACRAAGIESGLKPYVIGSFVFLACAILDFALFLANVTIRDSYGIFSRLSLLVLIFLLMLKFFSWWTKDQDSIERDRFINRTMQFAVSSDAPESSISAMLEFLGTEFKAGRILIFEEQANHKYHTSITWSEEGRSRTALDLLYLPATGFVDDLCRSLPADNRSLIVRNIEEQRTKHPDLYNVLRSYNVSTMAACPLEVDDVRIGLFLWIDLPTEELESAADCIGPVSYFVSQLLLRRDEQKRLRYFSFNDFMTGLPNRQAFREFTETELDQASAFGYLVCELPDLKAVSTSKGYEAGDRMVLDMSGCLTEVFGKEHVFRVGGAKFAAIGFETEESFFLNDVHRVARNAEEKKLRIKKGAVYCANGTMNIDQVINHADALLRRDLTSD